MQTTVIAMYLAAGVFMTGGILLGRATPVEQNQLAVLVSIGTALPALLSLVFVSFAGASMTGFGMGLSSGFFNGLGLMFLFGLIALGRSGATEVSVVIPIAYSLIIVGVALGARYYFGDVITLTRVGGMMLICAGIWFVR